MTWNGREHLDACLQAVAAQQGVSAETILVDNGSTDGTVDHVRHMYPWVRLVALGSNHGFAAGTNAGVREARGRFVALLNNDTAPDLIAANNGSGDLSVYLNNGVGMLIAQPAIGAGAGARALAVANVNGDTFDDVFVANAGANTIGVYIGDGIGYPMPGSVAAGASPTWVAVADVNGDGKLDLASANNGASNVGVSLGNGRARSVAGFRLLTHCPLGGGRVAGSGAQRMARKGIGLRAMRCAADPATRPNRDVWWVSLALTHPTPSARER